MKNHHFQFRKVCFFARSSALSTHSSGADRHWKSDSDYHHPNKASLSSFGILSNSGLFVSLRGLSSKSLKFRRLFALATHSCHMWLMNHVWHPEQNTAESLFENSSQTLLGLFLDTSLTIVTIVLCVLNNVWDRQRSVLSFWTTARIVQDHKGYFKIDSLKVWVNFKALR